jgi:DNA-binding LacI/PurR family transcriptional regulator
MPQKKPKYMEIAEKIRRDISAGVLQPGDRLPSFSEMRAELGIGQGTLERVHALLEKEDLIVRQASRGVFVSEPKPAKRAGARRTGVLGICGTHSLGRNFVYETQLLEGVQNVALEAGLELQLLSEASATGWDRVDGVLHYYGSGKLAHLPPVMPSVSLLNPRAGFHCVLADDVGGAQAATQHLLELGHRRIALMTTREQNFHERRFAGYEKALRDAGIEPRPEWIRPITHFERSSGYVGSGRETMRAWLLDNWHELGCSALLAQNDDTAIGAIHACAAAGISVPEQLSVIGFDGAEAAEWFLPRLTTVQVPFRKIGERGARLLLELIRDPALPAAQINVPVHLRIGETTAPRVEGALHKD